MRTFAMQDQYIADQPMNLCVQIGENPDARLMWTNLHIFVINSYRVYKKSSKQADGKKIPLTVRRSGTCQTT